MSQIKGERRSQTLEEEMIKILGPYIRLLSFFISLLLQCSFLAAKTVSVIIPCYYKHADQLPMLLKHLSNQSMLPEEVVISLSEADKCERWIIDSIGGTNYPFQVKLLQTNEKLSAGLNRNIACSNAQGDIFITQDADDIPHTQRVEIIKFVFENYNVDHVIHKWIPDPTQHSPEQMAQFYWGQYIPRKIHVHKIEKWNVIATLPYITRGNIGIRRYVFDEIKWIDKDGIGEDTIFCLQAFRKFKKTCLINVNLLIYRWLK